MATLPGCISEIARVYRASKRGDVSADVARTRTYILDKLRAGLEAQTLVDRKIGWMKPRPVAGLMEIGQARKR